MSKAGTYIKQRDLYGYQQKGNKNYLDDALAQLHDHKIALDEAAIVAETDLSGRITYVNDKFCQISKYSRNELIGKPHKIINSGFHSKEFWQDFWRTITIGNIWRGIIRNKAKDGTYYWVSTVVVPFRKPSGQIYKYVAIRHEITKEKELQAQLAQQIEVAEKALNSTAFKSRFISEMSHEIRGALNCIMGFSELLSMSELDENLKLYVEKIKKSSGYILGLMNDILDASRLEASKVVLDESPFDLRESLSTLMVMVEGSAKNKGLLLETTFSEDVPQIILGDQYRLSQILLNFLNNAVKYTDFGKIILSAEVLGQDSNREQAQLRFSVSDTGRGISLEEQRNLFVEFEQCRPADVSKGTGLGLAICIKLSNLMKGEIKVTSVAGKGSTFSLQIWMKLSLNLPKQ